MVLDIKDAINLKVTEGKPIVLRRKEAIKHENMLDIIRTLLRVYPFLNIPFVPRIISFLIKWII